MVLESKDKRYFITLFVCFGIAIVVATAALSIGGVNLFLRPILPGPGSTPVILVGDSVKLDGSSSEKVAWAKDSSGNGYSAQGQGAITSISIQDPGQNEHIHIKTVGEDISLMLNVDSCDGSNHTIQVSQANSDHVIHATPPSGEQFNFSQYELEYKHVATCSGGGVPNKFSSVSVTVGGIPLGTFNCTDAIAATPSGRCRVVLTE
jgi:hypothetical protein